LIACFIGISSLGIYEIIKSKSEYTRKIETMVITKNIVDHYMSLSKIAVDLSYLHLTYNQNYDFKSFQMALRDNIMTLQRTNQFFKSYSQT
jgi:hypothetical protein